MGSKPLHVAMPGSNAVATGSAGVLLTTIMGSTLMTQGPPTIESIELPVNPVNLDHSILSHWLSEEIDTWSDEPLSEECAYFNFTTTHEGEFCSPFVVSRLQPATLRAAAKRALKCAAKSQVECILSPEVGLAVPAVFLHDHTQEDLKVIVAPRVLPLHDDVQTEYVRVNLPGDSFGSRTLQMNNTLSIEYMTKTKQIEKTILRNEEAYCVNLLRLAFESECWAKLDG